MTDTITLIIAGTECTLAAEELTLERIVAEARSIGYETFSVFCNNEEIEKPEDFKLIRGATYIIASADDTINPDDIVFNAGEE